MKPILMVPYDKAWPKIFEQESNQLKEILKNNCIAIHHIGSTAVPGLSAKPVIDMILVVHNTKNTQQDLECLNYTYKGVFNIPFRHFFSKTIKSHMKYHVHVHEIGSGEISMNLLFRDFLRTYPVYANEYEILKQELLSQESSYEKKGIFTQYTLGKNYFIQNILKKTHFNETLFRFCTHEAEWEAYNHIYKINQNTDAHFIHDENHIYFVMYQGTEITTVCYGEIIHDAFKIHFLKSHLNLLNQDSTMLHYITKWINQINYKLIDL